MIKDRRFARKRVLALVPVAGLLALAVAGCTAQGGGFIDSANNAKNGKATFGLNWQQTSPDAPVILRGAWHDGSVDFRLDDGDFFFPTYGNCVEGTGHYVSTNKANKGDGLVYIAICDYGEPGPTNGDSIFVDPTSGPYAWYENGGRLRGGNLQVKIDP